MASESNLLILGNGLTIAPSISLKHKTNTHSIIEDISVLHFTAKLQLI